MKATYLIISLLCVINLCAQPRLTENLTFNSYRPELNLDSLEQVLLKTPKNTLAYTDLLLKYEHSHLHRHDVHSKYTQELIYLHNNESNPARKAMFNFLFGWRLISAEAQSQVISLNEAVTHFEATSDTAGIVNCYGLLVWLNYGTQKVSEPESRSKTYLRKMAMLSNKSTDLGVQSINTFYKVYYLGSSKTKKSFEEQEQELKDLISKVKARPAYLPYLNLLLNLQGVLYMREAKYQLALQTFKKIHIENKKDSFSYLLNLANIGDAYYSLGEHERAKPFYEKVISQADLTKNDLLLVYQFAYYGLGLITQQSDPKKSAKCFKNAFEANEKHSEFEHKRSISDIEAILEQKQAEKKIKTISAEKLRIEQQNLQIKLLLGFALLLLLGIGVLALRFYQLNIRLKKITRSRGKLFNIIAHDLRSPLSAYSEIAEDMAYLLKTRQHERLIGLAKHLDTNAQNLIVVLGNLFQWSLSELGIVKPKRLVVDVIETVQPTLRLYQNMAEQKKLRLTMDLPQAYELTTDPNLLLTIFRNSLDNALKYAAPQGSVAVELREDADKTLLIVRNDFSDDNPPDFTAVRQLINENKNFNYGEAGIGMGLLLVKQFADALQMPILFKTEAQQAVFELTL